MNKKIKILHIEDLKSDSELVDRELTRAEIIFEKVLVENKDDFIRELTHFNPDIVISDHSLPSFDSQEALKLLKESGYKIPFILVTATVSEEYAVNIMKNGASDYILKDRLQRLPNAVISAIDRFELEQRREEADAEIRNSEKKYKLLFDTNPLPMWIVNSADNKIMDVNEAAIIHYQYSREDFCQLEFPALIRETKENDPLIETSQENIQVHQRSDGTPLYVEVMAHNIDFGDQPARLILANNITQKVEAERELAKHRALQQQLIAKTSIQAQEKEREEIGKELHDNINQILASIRLYLESSTEEEDHNMLIEMLNKSISSLDKAILEIRMLSHKLVAPSLGQVSLAKSIMELISNLQRVTSLKMNFRDKDFAEEHLDKDVKLMCYRIVQEQLNNILKHADAKNSMVKLSTIDDQIHLMISDDGVGFDPKEIFPGIGLRNIANRAELYNGRIAINSSPGNGCTLDVYFPLDPGS